MECGRPESVSPGCGHTLASSNSDDFYSFDVKTIMFFFSILFSFHQLMVEVKGQFWLFLPSVKKVPGIKLRSGLSDLEVSSLTHSSIFLVLI